MIMKIMALTKNKDDIILLSDTRLNSEKQTAALHDLYKVIFNEGYELFHQSPNSSRGVGILISRKLNYNLIECSRDAIQITFCY
jgi:exonuclease III